MATKRSNKSRNTRGRRPNNAKKKRVEEQLPKRVFPELMCAWCDKLVQKPQEALVYNAEHLHFSCIRARLLDEYTIAEGEDIVYIGQGSFAHVAYENPQTKTSYHVLSRIAVETEEERYQFLRFLEDEKEVPGGIDFYDDGIPSGFGDSSRTDNLDIRDLVLGSYQDEMEGPEW